MTCRSVGLAKSQLLGMCVDLSAITELPGKDVSVTECCQNLEPTQHCDAAITYTGLIRRVSGCHAPPSRSWTLGRTPQSVMSSHLLTLSRFLASPST